MHSFLILISENFGHLKKKFTGPHFEGRTLQLFAFGRLLVPTQTLYLLFRISDSFDRKLKKKFRKFRYIFFYFRKKFMDEALNLRIEEQKIQSLYRNK